MEQRQRFGEPLETDDGFDFAAMRPGKEADFLAGMIASLVTNDPRPPAIEVRNGRQLIVHTNHANHTEIAGLLASLEVLADLAVVPNARLIEVDRALYDKYLAPLFAESKSHLGGRTLARADTTLVKLLEKQATVLAGESLKIVPGPNTEFLSWTSVRRYVDAQERTGHGTFHTGLTFSLKATVSDDRRRLEVKIVQTATELVDVKKTKILDVKTAKELEVEAPNLRKSSITGSLVIEDGQPVVMPVAYRSDATRKQDRLWVLLAAPTIYIEEEEAQIRAGNLPRPTKPDEPEPADKPKPRKKPPAPARSEKVEQLLHAVVYDLLTSEDFKFERDFRNRPGNMKFRLEDGEHVSWPDWFQPSVRGYTRDHGENAGPDHLELNPGHVLVIRLTHFDLNRKILDDFDTPIEVIIHNQAFIRGVWVHYAPKREGKRWSVECYGSHSP